MTDQMQSISVITIELGIIPGILSIGYLFHFNYYLAAAGVIRHCQSQGDLQN